MSSLEDFLLPRRRDGVEITTGSVSPEIKRSLANTGDVAECCEIVCADIRVCNAGVCGTVEAVTGGAMRRKSLARFQSGFYARPLFAAKNDYTAGGRDIGLARCI